MDEIDKLLLYMLICVIVYTFGDDAMNVLDVLEWMIQNKVCICGGKLEEVDGALQCKKCGLKLR